MRISTSLPLPFALIGLASATDWAGCGGIGSCMQLGNCNWVSNSYDCGKAGTISIQRSAEYAVQLSVFGMTAEGTTVIEKSEFPAKCQLSQPNEDAVLLKYVPPSASDVVVYAFAYYVCNSETGPPDECYSTTTNPASLYICRVDKGGNTCTVRGGSNAC